MWLLKSIHATNICAFETLEYAIVQNQATLIFGNNMDSDSQNSNGSGKSAMIEAIAIGLTGEPLRKVNMDEIINDRFDIATVRIVLWNDMENVQLTISRKLSRKQPQEILIQKQSGPYDTDTEDVVLSTVADYNKYVLDQIGLSKDDLFSNFILTARKYKSFLSSSDKEKKDLINRFSNGIIVDESIQALLDDMEPVQNESIEAGKKVAECEGSIVALETEIEKAVNDAEARQASRKERIANWKEAIAKKREEIRNIRESIANSDERLDSLDALDEQLQSLEKSDVSTVEAWAQICSLFKKADIQCVMTDFDRELSNLQKALNDSNAKASGLNTVYKEAQSSLDKLLAAYATLETDHTTALQQIDSDSSKVKEQIDKLSKEVKGLMAKSDELEEKRKKLNRSIAGINNQLAGVIQCPKCKHEFLLSDEADVTKLKAQLTELNAKLTDLKEEIDENSTAYNECVAKGKTQRQQQTALTEKRDQQNEMYNKATDSIQKARKSLASAQGDIDNLTASIQRTQASLNNIRKRMFDEVFSALDSEITKTESLIKQDNDRIAVLEGSIKTYEESIKEAESAVDDDIISSLKESLEKNREALQTAILNKEKVNERLNEFKVQEATFTEFKTHLANSKIDAISQITNEFLEAIGSDIRVALSGYTILKSGKVRDKISVSLLRDGVDCGSFDKFSRGEQTRVELANILAIHHLINTNCEEGKGLNLLIIDELLDATDENGLTNVFRALNDTQTTSLVVSHGNIAENYPNRLIINKQNGVSFI